MSSLLQFENPQSKIAHWSCEAGQRFLLVAPTGWGKTVWLRQLALLRDADTSNLQWNGRPVTTEQSSLYRSRWIYLSQFMLRSPQTVEEHFQQVFSLKTNATHSFKDFLPDLEKALNELGMKFDVRQRRLQDLSGGELQCLALARTVLLSPEGVFLDEPTAAMDPELCERVENWFCSRFKGVCIWVSHNTLQVERLKLHQFQSIL